VGVGPIASAEEEGVDDKGEHSATVELRQIDPGLRLVLRPFGLFAQGVILNRHTKRKDETPDVQVNVPYLHALAKHSETGVEHHLANVVHIARPAHHAVSNQAAAFAEDQVFLGVGEDHEDNA